MWGDDYNLGARGRVFLQKPSVHDELQRSCNDATFRWANFRVIYDLDKITCYLHHMPVYY